MVQTLIRENVHPAHSTKINLYHVDAGFFVRLVLTEIRLRTPSEILSFLRMASCTGSAVSGGLAGIDAALHLNKQNMRFVFANNVRFQMAPPIIAA